MGQKTAPLFCTKFSMGKRTFFIDVVRTEEKTLAMVIRTSEPAGHGQWKRNEMTVHGHEVQEFCQAVADSSAFILNR